MSEETFNVHITFSNGDGFVEHRKTLPELIRAIARLTRGPAAMGGLIKEVRAVDSGDRMVFWVKDNRVLFPKAPSV